MICNDALERGGLKRVPDRWQTDFGHWATDSGLPRIVAELAHDPVLRIINQAVYEWFQGHAPHPSSVMAHLDTANGIDR